MIPMDSNPAIGEINAFESSRLETLAARYYTEPDILKRELSDLLYNSWQFVCHESQLPSTGDFFAFTLHGREFFLVRTSDGDLKGYHNVCPHRGHRLVEGRGNKSQITCPYHAWTFALDGRLRGARGVERETARAPTRSLIPVRVDQLVGLVFVNANLLAPSLEEFLPGLQAQVLRACPNLIDYIPGEGGEGFGANYVCKANWKIMLDNALECYHCQTAHREFSDMMHLESNKITLHKNYVYNNLPTAGKSENKAFPLDLENDVLVGEFWWVFPNMLLGQFPGVQNFYVSRFDPLELGKTSRATFPLRPKAPTDEGASERERLRSIWTTNVVSAEDQALCENVQRGLQTAFSHGWYVTDPDDHSVSEHAMRYFHELYLTWVQSETSASAPI